MSQRFGREDGGASLVEYALLGALIVMVCIAAVSFLGKIGSNRSNRFTKMGRSIGG